MSSEPPQRTSTLSAQEMSGHVGQCRQDTSLNSVLETLSEGHFVDIRGICGHFMDICGHLRTYLNFAACPDKLACPQGFLSFVLSEDMSRTCPGQMKLRHYLPESTGGLCRWCRWFFGWKGPMILEQHPPTMEASFTRRKYGRGGYLLRWRVVKKKQRDLSSCISVSSIDNMLWVYCKKCKNWGPFPL
jgi:hypothetical protein